MRTNLKIKKRYIILIAVALMTPIFLYWQNNDILTTKMTYINKKIPAAFDGFVIVQISDLHNMRFGKNQNVLLAKVKAAQPDMIIVTGDIIDNEREDIPIAMEFINGAMSIAPIYFISGNHEARIDDYDQLVTQLSDAGVYMMDNKQILIERNASFIELAGIVDPFFTPAKTSLGELKLDDKTTFKILLSHRPELIKLYASKNIDLVFAGHAHGGQIRIPYLMPGLIAPNQGFFPQYTSGKYIESSTTEIVSRGLGNSTFPFRIFNQPEIIVVTLRNK
jgi:predicted MPP superfamily phosphohydrolase